MDAKISIASGKSTRGKSIGCTGTQCYALVLDVSTRDASGCYPEIFVGGPHDDPRNARVEARKWASDQGIEITGDFQPRAITGADADIRANSPRTMRAKA